MTMAMQFFIKSHRSTMLKDLIRNKIKVALHQIVAPLSSVAEIGIPIEEVTRDGKYTFIYDKARLEDVEEVTEFASKYYFNSPPILQLGSFDDPLDESGRYAWRQGRLQVCFKRPTSFLVRDKSNGNLVAFLARCLEERSKPLSGNYGVQSNPSDRSVGWLNRAITAELLKGVDPSGLLVRDSDLIIVPWFAAVRPDVRRQGILSRMMSIAMELDKANKVAAQVAVSFSHFGCREPHWKVIRSINLSTFELPDGTRPLAGVDLGVHKVARLNFARVTTGSS